MRQRRSLTCNSLRRNTNTGEELLPPKAPSLVNDERRYSSNVLTVDQKNKRGLSA